LGGTGTNRLLLAHPDLYAKAVVLSGAEDWGANLENARWVPYFIANGALDELVPIDNAISEANALKQLGYRYRFELYPAEDHVVYSLKDGFLSAAESMKGATRETAPGHVTFRWSPAAARPTLGLTFTTAYWLSALTARAGATTARIDAFSAAQPDRTVTPDFGVGVIAPGNPSP